jgi:hypothetical protein
MSAASGALSVELDAFVISSAVEFIFSPVEFAAALKFPST